MSGSEPAEFRDETFCGTTRLFPLPNLVMFPHVIQALHIFEPRYRQLLADALKSDHLMSLAVLRPDPLSEGSAKVGTDEMVCLTRVISCTPQPGGRSNILVMGLRRARIVCELPLCHAYREARVELVSDQFDGSTTALARRRQLAARLLGAIQGIVHSTACGHFQLGELLGEAPCLGLLTDLLGYSLPLTLDQKLRLLHEPDVERRASWLLESMLPTVNAPMPDTPRTGKFPPKFSCN